jgi:formylmethanofuran dehydrogenase subunit C
MPLVLTQKLKARDLFDSLDREKEQGVDRRIEVKRDEKLEEITGYFEYILEYGWLKNLSYRESYGRMSERPVYSSKEIEKFSLAIGKYQESKEFDSSYGILLSSLINQSNDKYFILHTGYLTTYPNYIGYLNSKNIIIKGNAGDSLGQEMQKGSIIVEGDTKYYAGSNMNGGLIEITGNVKNSLGYEMKGGKIIVRGNAGMDTGNSMINGEIIVFGNADRELGRWMDGGVIRVYGEAGDNLGSEMEYGKIFIFGNAGNKIGYKMKYGEIHLDGDYDTISKDIQGGNIYHGGKRIIQEGKTIAGLEVKWY